ncbi:MAG: hypothetical protein RBS24_03525 [Bacilli bacterium]|nr:hypothetical protein [Bacilli bacterium]
MKGLFGKLGKGILFVVVFPFWLIAFVLFAIYSIFVFLFTLFAAIPAYLKGESVLSPDELDIAASKKLAEQKLQAQTQPPAPIVQPQTTIILNAVPQQPQVQPHVSPEEKEIVVVNDDSAPMQQITIQDFQESLHEEVKVGEGEDK